MESFKIELYQQKYGKQFPAFKEINSDILTTVRQKMFVEFQVNNGLELVLKMRQSATFMDDINACDDTSFNLECIFQHLNLHIPICKILINWFHFESLDEFSFNDFSKYFYDIWYPGADDIDILDESCDWFISIQHDGEIFVWEKE